MSDKVLFEQRGAVAVITLNAPEKRNAIDLEMVRGLHDVLDRLLGSDDVAVLVLTGAGDRAFAAGADIAQLKERSSPDALAAINASIFKRIEDFPCPSIAAIRGYALGGGCELAIACDLRVAGRSAKMGQPEVGLGIMPAAGGTYRLPRLVGLGKARELIYTGRVIDADECLRIGLVNDVVDDAEVLPRAMALAEEIAARGKLAVRLAKATMNALARPNEGLAVSMESVAQALLFDSDDKHRRMAAFLERSRTKAPRDGGSSG
ncbi:MAG: enoyl-CoA hydratase/isomerase family protein [Planctomycetes bacterium]|nr:enoyl-CoA hydratase/isomerase family protein [Planctomycetota bacterium]MCB9868933.1 enoyl-CoA hydratase/isomerase family protein [Planctomycetota bacterium]